MINPGRTSLSYAGYYGRTFEEFIDLAADFGFGGVQLIPDQAPNLVFDLPPSRLGNLRRQLSDRALRVSVHNVFYDINLVSLVPPVRDFAFDVTKRVIDVMHAIGSTRMTAHPGYIFPGWRHDTDQRARFWESARIAINELSRLAASEGIDIYLENGSYYVTSKRGQNAAPLHVGTSVEEMAMLLETSGDHLGVCLDIGKAIVSEESVDAFIERFGGKIGQLQISTPARFAEVMTHIGLSSRIESGSLEVIFEGNSQRVNELLKMAEH